MEDQNPTPQINPQPEHPPQPPSPLPPHQNSTPQPTPIPTQSTNPTTNIDKKIRFWKRFSLILGLISFFGYILTLVIANVLAHGTQYGWVIFMIVGLYIQRAMLILCILSIISIIRVIILSTQRKKHLFKDYAIAIAGLILIFSPFAVTKILSFFRISWNEDNSVSVSVKSKDPYYINGSVSSSSVCVAGYRTSNDLKNVDINDYYSYVDGAKERKLFATEKYLSTISGEILCQVGEFYKKRGRYPSENEIKNFASQAANDDIRAGIYDIKLETGNTPNDRDFTILFDKNCSNQTSDPGNIVVLSPLYGAEGRYCVYNDIDRIVDNLGTIKE